MSDEEPSETPPKPRVSAPPASAGRSRQLERMLDSGPRATTRSWVQLILFTAILVGLFLARDEFGRRAAGCYGQVSDTDAAVREPVAAPERVPPGTFAPVVEIRRTPSP